MKQHTHNSLEKMLTIRSAKAHELLHTLALRHRMKIKDVLIAALKEYRDSVPEAQAGPREGETPASKTQ